MSDVPAPEQSLHRALQALFRLGGFAAVFATLLLVASLVVGLTDNLFIQGTASCFAAFVATALLLRIDGRRSLADVGLHRGGVTTSLARSFGFGVAIVMPAVAVAVVGGLRYGAEGGTVIEYLAIGAWTALVLFFLAAAEEFLFRGYPLLVVAERWGKGAALALTTVAFSGLHGWNPNMDALALLNIALAGGLLGIVRIVTGSLWHAIGVHAGWNFSTGFLADLPVSGMSLVDAPLIEVTRPGSELWMGGDAGLEGGLGSTLAIALGGAYVMWGHRAGRWKAAEAGAPAREPAPQSASGDGRP